MLAIHYNEFRFFSTFVNPFPPVIIPKRLSSLLPLDHIGSLPHGGQRSLESFRTTVILSIMPCVNFQQLGLFCTGTHLEVLLRSVP